MKYFFRNRRFFLPVLLAVILFSCRSTKYVADNEYLLHNIHINADDKRISKTEAKKYLRQRPNSKILGFIKFNLGLYNLSGKDDSKKINRYLRNTGEAPIIFDLPTTKRSVKQLGLFLGNKGFYNASVKDSVVYKNKKATVFYNIAANRPHIINKVFKKNEEIPSNFLSKKQIKLQLPDDTDIRKKIIRDTLKKTLEKGMLLDADILQKERENTVMDIKNDGYFDFSEKHIHFLLDTFKTQYSADLYWGIKQKENESDSVSYHIKYKIRNVYYQLNSTDVEINDIPFDTVLYRNTYFIYKGKPFIKFQVLVRTNFINDSIYYNLDNINKTYDRLRLMQQFKYIHIDFEKVNPTNLSEQSAWLDCFIKLSPYKKQAYTIEAEATSNSGNYGIAGNLTYQNKNLFRGAEILDVELTGGIERVESYKLEKFNARQYGAILGLTTPRFLFPFASPHKITKKYNPFTEFSIAYNFHNRPQYTRTIADISFGYRWKAGENWGHILSPIDIGLIKVSRLDDLFFNSINNLYLRSSFQDHIISSTRYSLIYNDGNKGLANNGKYFRFNIEFAGNILSLYDRITGTEKQTLIDIDGKVINNVYKHFGIQYAQYIRSDADYSFYHHLDKTNRFVYHVFLGMGFPYGNSLVMPFEKLYYAGGANSMRAWQARTLGPGSSQQFSKEDNLSYGDMRFEINFEYRFTLINAFEGAFFIDAGNVWSTTKLYNDELAKFKFDRFYKELGIGTGLGLRLNFDFLLLRLDVGMPLFDPYLPEGKRFVPKYRSWQFNDAVFNLGIGYPF